MSRTLLTYTEFKNIVIFHDNTGQDDFLKLEVAAEETYLTGLIGVDLVDAVVGGEYDELLPLIKKCLAYYIQKIYVENGNILVNKNGISQRNSDYTDSVEYRDKKNKIKSIIEQLQQYESRLIALIVAGDYDEYNDNTTVTAVNHLKITAIGD